MFSFLILFITALCSAAVDIEIIDRRLVEIFPLNTEIMESGINENRSTISRGFKSGLSAGIVTTAPGVIFDISGTMEMSVQSVRETVDKMSQRLINKSVEEKEKILEIKAEASISAFLKFFGFRGGSQVSHYDKTKTLNMRISDDLHEVITNDKQAWTGSTNVRFSLKGISRDHFTAHHRAYVETFVVKVDDVTIQVIENSPGVVIADPNTGKQSADVDNNDSIVIID